MTSGSSVDDLAQKLAHVEMMATRVMPGLAEAVLEDRGPHDVLVDDEDAEIRVGHAPIV